MKNTKKLLGSVALLSFFMIFAFIPIQYGDSAIHIDPGIEYVNIADHQTAFNEVLLDEDSYPIQNSDDFLIYLVADNDHQVCDEVRLEGSHYSLSTVNLSECIKSQVIRNKGPDNYKRE